MSKKLLFLYFFLFSVFGAFAQNLHSQANAASIDNEANSTTGWTGTGNITSSTTNPFQGTYAISLVATQGNASTGRNMSYTFNAVVGQVYNISIWARQGNLANSPAFANWTGFAGFATTTINSAAWTQYNWSLTATNATPVINVYSSPISGSQAGNQVFVDAVSITTPNSDNQPPTAVVVSSSNTTSTGTQLSWTASTDNVGVVNYEVFQDGNSIANTGTTTGFNVTGLTPSTSYNFTVVAEDAAGNLSPVSNVETINTLNPPDTQAPTAVVLSSSNTTTTSTELSWTASTDNVGVVNYEVFRNGNSIANTGTTTGFNVTGLAPSTSYNFTVVAEDAAGNLSPSSNILSVTTDGVPDNESPTAVVVSSSNTTSVGTQLSWTASTDNVGVVNYEVFQDGNSIANTGTTTGFNVTGLAPSTSYDFTVVAEDAAGNLSPVSNTVTIVTSVGNGIVDYTSENANIETVDWTARDLFADRNIGIGTTDTQGYRLAVAGNVIAEGVKVELQGNWPDFVFENGFDLMDLWKVRAFIAEHGHLPNIPSAEEVQKEGIDLGQMNAKLLQKIEELTLYILSQQNEIEILKKENSQINDILKRIEELEKGQQNR
ncbi:fibronectin type III domain-containing protein [Flagellimonas amoyensis]|uniref:fibronectin type III domain-containing protein n=1 Tax=Flagellimonas amoyensis TaxID=2169401 RepID=UPI000D3D96C8|nr:fibronectin type III domain-containing protein [Allomuricauda amoyensis]